MWILIVLIGVVNAAPSNLIDFTPVNRFSLKLLDNAYSFQDNFGVKNIALAPPSVWSLFALLAEGSSGETFKELVKGLQLPEDLKSTQCLHTAANSLLKSNYGDITLKGFTTVYAACEIEVHKEFCDSAELYDTSVYRVETDNTTKLASDINFLICYATDGKILNAVKPQDLENLRMILLDSIYFKANWTHPFDPTQTKEESFYNTQGKTIGSVNMMYHKAPHHLGDVDELEAQVLEMTYGKNEQFSMLILLPYDGISVKKLLNNLVTKPLNWMNEFQIDGSLPGIDTYIPRFTLSSRLDLIPPMQYGGIQSIFNRAKSELPGVSDRPLFVSSAVQNVAVEVTEEGTVAAASTVVGLEDRILGQRFEANKEFVFLIVLRKCNAILFSGVYAEPSLV